jgi:hypothetical protein
VSPSRPDLSYSVGALSQVMAGASKKQWDMGLDVVRYLKGAKDLGSTYKQHKDYKDMSVVAHADSDFANDTVSGNLGNLFMVMLCMLGAMQSHGKARKPRPLPHLQQLLS